MATKPSYHREDLRADLLRAGHAYVAELGHEGLSVRALAQRVGVSPGAPYHHFPDRRALLLALAVDGFQRLAARGREVRTRPASAEQKLVGLATEFLDFQVEHPRLLELMYESELSQPTIDPRIVDQQLNGFELLRGAIEEAVPSLGYAETRARAVAFWSAIFGYASLVGKGLLQPFASEEDITAGIWRDALIRQAVMAAVAPLD